ncbi:MAG TPA: RNA polymerase sigma factor [Mycobacteriales bacterium]|nr:RNA polymerase sigma factor [Mycobacteriales bacterium]
MTTAPDLPVTLPTSPPALSPVTPVAPAPRPALAVVPEPDRTGDVVDFDDALRRAAPRLQRYAVRRLHDPHEAEEVVQEALLRAFQHRDRLATEDDLMAWVTVVTGRLVIDRLRVRGRAVAVAELPAGIRTGRDTAEVVVARDEARIALDALEAMPARQASVLWAREVEGLSYDEIGVRYGLSEPSVRSVLHRARKTLRREYATRGGTLPAVGLVALAPWLRGLHAAGKMRVAARRVATAAAVTATGLAAVTAVPFVTPTAPGTVHPAMSPALGVRPVAHAQQRHLTPATRPSVHHAPVAASAAPAHTSTPTATVMPDLPHVGCGRSGMTVGCTTHRGHALFVKMPVPINGQEWVGVSTDEVDCHLVPANPLVQCDSHGGNS